MGSDVTDWPYICGLSVLWHILVRKIYMVSVPVFYFYPWDRQTCSLYMEIFHTIASFLIMYHYPNILLLFFCWLHFDCVGVMEKYILWYNHWWTVFSLLPFVGNTSGWFLNVSTCFACFSLDLVWYLCDLVTAPGLYWKLSLCGYWGLYWSHLDVWVLYWVQR